MYDYIIIGAGFAGCILAERLAADDKKILLIDKRPHIGGNAYDFYNDEGILCHKYGPHIFHTNSKEVFDYLSNFTEWHEYEHKVLSQYDLDKPAVPVPINRNTINKIYDLDLTTDAEAEAFLKNVAVDKKVMNGEDAVISKVGVDLYDKLFKNYTVKQWGVTAAALAASVTARIPVRYNDDDRYFTDKYQYMPKHGYSDMFSNMILSDNITVKLNTDYHSIIPLMLDAKIICTGPIDEYFGYLLGKLPYRSLDFKFATLDAEISPSEFILKSAQLNFPNDFDYTRIVEFKQITGQKHHKTTICSEFPKAEGDPYYPIPCEENQELYEQYKALAKGLEGRTYFVGRLASYKYYNMDQVCAQALTLYRKIKDESTK